MVMMMFFSYFYHLVIALIVHMHMWWRYQWRRWCDCDTGSNRGKLVTEGNSSLTRFYHCVLLSVSWLLDKYIVSPWFWNKYVDKMDLSIVSFSLFNQFNLSIRPDQVSPFTSSDEAGGLLSKYFAGTMLISRLIRLSPYPPRSADTWPREDYAPLPPRLVSRVG